MQTPFRSDDFMGRKGCCKQLCFTSLRIQVLKVAAFLAALTSLSLYFLATIAAPSLVIDAAWNAERQELKLENSSTRADGEPNRADVKSSSAASSSDGEPSRAVAKSSSTTPSYSSTGNLKRSRPKVVSILPGRSKKTPSMKVRRFPGKFNAQVGLDWSVTRVPLQRADSIVRVPVEPVEKVEFRSAVHQVLLADRPFHPFQYLIEPNVCKENGAAKIVVYASVSPVDATLRNSLRQLWTTEARKYGIEVVFAVGRRSRSFPQDDDGFEMIVRESEQFGDILLTNFEDSYQHLIIKFWTDLDYHVHHCSQISFMAVIDVDTIIFAENFANFLTENGREYEDSLGCLIWTGPREKRPGHIWYVSDDQWPRDYLMPYCLGIMIITSTKTARRVLETIPQLGMQYFSSFTIWDVPTGPLAQLAKVPLKLLPGLYPRYSPVVVCSNTTIAFHPVKKVSSIAAMIKYRSICCIDGYNKCLAGMTSSDVFVPAAKSSRSTIGKGAKGEKNLKERNGTERNERSKKLKERNGPERFENQKSSFLNRSL